MPTTTKAFLLILTTLLNTTLFLPLAAAEPHILGHGEGRFVVGDLLDSDDFENLENWEVQLQKRDGFPPAHIRAEKGSLDCLVPGRGATVWFKKKLKTRLAITYEVICPDPNPAIKGVSPRDINNFWMASDPDGDDLFDGSRFTGDFTTYHKMHGCYASTGGGTNKTTRMRRYPREKEGAHADHLFLNSRDGQEEYLIEPGKVITVQLVAYDDLFQYIVDGKLVYELKKGDRTRAETRTEDGVLDTRRARYDLERFPAYTEGYFGLRMVGTHHIYRKFRVHSLKPPEPKDITVSSIEDLRKAVKGSFQRITMKPGTYVVGDLEDRSSAFILSGSNNEIGFTGVKFETPVSTLRKMQRSRRSHPTTFTISGDKVSITGGVFENTYPDGLNEITDFGSYNQDPELHPAGAMTEFRLSGDDITMTRCKLIVRGSSPYGYGNMYGIGGGAVIDLKKHSGILTTGDRPVIDGCQVKMEAFGHAIFFQGGDDILVRNCTVLGELRRSDDLYKETDNGDLPRKFDYKLQWPESVHGVAIPKDHMINLAEDGIRAYPGTRHVTVENCRVAKMRSGVKLYLARSASISDCQVLDCVVQGYSLPSNGKIIRGSGNAAFGPLLYIHSDSNNSQEIDLTVLPAPHSLGDHPLAAINGERNSVRFTPAPGPADGTLRPIIVGFPLRFDFLCVDYPKVPAGYEKHFARFAPEKYRAARNTVINKTTNPVVLGTLANDNSIESIGKVVDYGSDND